MSDKIFIDILNMSFIGSFAILITIIARLCLKKAPKIFSYLLWFVVLFRLVVPFSFESITSILPFNSVPFSTDMLYVADPHVETGITAFDNVVNPIVALPTFGHSLNVYQTFILFGKIVWLIGATAFTIHSIISYIKFKRKLANATLLHDNIYISKSINIPFVIGFLKAKIYLPFNLTEEERDFIILHEQTHIRRRDNIAIFCSYIVLILHWFNPLVWVAYNLIIRDMEMSCDESVIKNAKTDIRKEYSLSLLSLAAGRRIVGTPVAFSEGNPKERIENIMKNKKAITLVSCVAFIAVIAIAICLIPNKPQFAPLTDVIDNIPAIRKDNVTYAEIITPEGKTEIANTQKVDELLTLIEALEINEKELNRSRASDRDSTNQIVFYRSDDTFDSTINFNVDYSEIWIGNNATSSFTYSVKDPEKIKADILAFIN